MGGGVQISAQKEEQPQADSQDQNPGPDPPAFPGPQKKRHPCHQGRDPGVEEQDQRRRTAGEELFQPRQERDSGIGNEDRRQNHQHGQGQFPFGPGLHGAHILSGDGLFFIVSRRAGPVKRGPAPGGHCPPGAVFSRSPYTSACSSSTDAIWRSSPPVPPSAGPSLCRLPADTPASAPQAAPGAAGSESRTRGSPRSAR